LPIAVVELYQASISVDTVYQYLPRSLQFFCMVVVLLGSAVLYLTLAWTSWGDAVRAFQVGEMMMGTVPVSIWPSRFVMPLSLALAGAVCVWHLTRLLRSQEARDELMAVRGPKEEAAEGQR
jgi:TRAP-type C4-dicarboxylate transport system permease small subunit